MSDDLTTYSPARERRVLNFLMTDGANAATIAASCNLTGSDFRGAKERSIFEAAMALHASGQLSADTLIEEVCLRRNLVEPADFAAITGLTAPDYAIVEVQLPQICRALKRLSRDLAMLNAAAQIPPAIKEGNEDAVKSALQALQNAPQSDLPRATWQQTGSAEISHLKAIAGGLEEDDGRSIPWPWRDWNQNFKPLQRGELCVVGAGPSLGKSSLIRQICMKGAQTGLNTAVVSLEMSAGSIFNLMAATLSRHPWQRFRELHLRDKEDFIRSAEVVRGLNVAVLDSESSMSAISSWIRAEHQRRYLDIVAIDYLGIIADAQASKIHQKAAAVGQVAGAFKRLATELGCVIILGCQVNRDSFNDNRPPRLSDLKDSGDIEAHADRVIFIHRPPEDSTGKTQSVHDSVTDRPRFFMQMLQDKGRNVGTGALSTWFNRELTSFEGMISREDTA